jgi:transcriptional regulator with XRE-family HTH domain
MTKKPKTKLHHWLAANPLRKFLLKAAKNGGVQARAGRPVAASPPWAQSVIAQIGVSRQTAYQWMAGIARPKLESLVAIEAATGITPAEWLRWYNQNPTKKGRATCSRP